jgi:hypothetical protein
MTETVAQVEQNALADKMDKDEDRGEALTATLRSAHYEERDLRRESLAHAVELNIAAFRGLGVQCDIEGKDVVEHAELFLAFLKGS